MPTSPTSSPPGEHKGVWVSKTALKQIAGPVTGSLTEQFGDLWYCITNYDQLLPFLITLPSASDHWMFVSSVGALTCGRKSADHALFPYVTDDKLHDAAPHTGPKTIILVERQYQSLLWEPFAETLNSIYDVQRNLYKNASGDKLMFEEVNHDLSLRFLYYWQLSSRYGFVRHARLESLWKYPIRVRVLDGFQNILPSGIPARMQNERSTLVDAYKVSELARGIGLYSLNSLIHDRPEPAEAMLATAVWTLGPPPRASVTPKAVLLSSHQLSQFRHGHRLKSEHKLRGERGSYFVEFHWTLPRQRSVEWTLVADVDQDIGQIAHLFKGVQDRATLWKNLKIDEREGRRSLRRLVGSADGFQCVRPRVLTLRHYHNALFNVLRGGIPVDNYVVRKEDLRHFVGQRNQALVVSPYWRNLPPKTLLHSLPETEDPQLERLLLEYLPLGFGRRHGDPSRPWNEFLIETHDANGQVRLNYSGNWRDLFQNWEALSCAFPALIPGMIATFVNASTADGHNPYRIGRFGIDWEVPDPSDPWSNIGYWGDHQIVYLLRLLEQSYAHDPAALEQLLSSRCFSYGNIPYRIRPYPQLLDDPHQSISFDTALHEAIAQRVKNMGADGRLLLDENEDVVLVTLAEKLLVPALAKLTSFVPGAGIWLNTQRPEWNDAQNGLPGWSCSTVTLQHLHRYLQVIREIFERCNNEAIAISEEIAGWINSLARALKEPDTDTALTDDVKRKVVMDALGNAGSAYREQLYAYGLSGHTIEMRLHDLAHFLEQARESIAPTLHASQRKDGLYYSYNWLRPRGDEAMGIEPNVAMLEGQVAALESGLLTAGSAATLLSNMPGKGLNSPIGYLLYPDRRTQSFVEKHCIKANDVARCSLARRLLAKKDDRLMSRADTGEYYFNAALVNEKHLLAQLDELANDGYAKAVERDRERILEIYRGLYRQNIYNGRAQYFFKYEGLGCIYWHMVSKLLLAVQRTFWQAVDDEVEEVTIATLAKHYFGIRKSSAYLKSPQTYGAFPQDPYSHSPKNKGAQQPGLTGLVKEDLLLRWGELGVRVREGRITFSASLLRKRDFLIEPASFEYFNLRGEKESLKLASGQLGFTYCQVPIVYVRAEEPRLRVKLGPNRTQERQELVLTRNESRALFNRTGDVKNIEVALHPCN